MKQTHKLGALGDAAAIVAASASISAAARQLGVERSTIHRWIADGKVPRPSGSPLRPVANTGGAKKGAEERPQTPLEWAAGVRKAYPLDATGEQLVDLAVQALLLAGDGEAKAEFRLSAMGRFQALVRQLNLGEEVSAAAPVRPRPAPVRAVARAMGDPRAALMAAK